MRVIEHQFSDLLRHPKDVTKDVEKGDVLLRRRDEPDLRLTRADREADRTETFGALGRAFRNLAQHNPSALDEALADPFRWLEFLPAADRRLFVDEFARVVTAAAEIDNYAPIGQLVREWRDTAEVHADPLLAGRLRRPINAAGEAVTEPPN
jgi:hypothetical protein